MWHKRIRRICGHYHSDNLCYCIWRLWCTLWSQVWDATLSCCVFSILIREPKSWPDAGKNLLTSHHSSRSTHQILLHIRIEFIWTEANSFEAIALSNPQSCRYLQRLAKTRGEQRQDWLTRCEWHWMVGFFNRQEWYQLCWDKAVPWVRPRCLQHSRSNQKTWGTIKI